MRTHVDGVGELPGEILEAAEFDQHLHGGFGFPYGED
jgi:hypothetical protein